MKRPILILLLIVFATIAKSQTTSVKTDTSLGKPMQYDPNQIFAAVEIQAQFPGGTTGFAEYIKNNQQMAPQTDPGKVKVNFVVELDGTLSGFKILRSPADVYSNEAIRLLKKSPKWKPGIQNGKTVRSYYTVVIRFGE